MINILITGATGNIGFEVIKSLEKTTHQLQITAGVREVESDQKKLANYAVKIKKFDFTDQNTYAPALETMEILFLLRPPQISDVERYFKPLIEVAIFTGIKHIVFLSVQGVEKSTIIPHHKIEKLIAESKIPYTFLRPAYFMQNFLGNLNQDLVGKKLIFLPAGHAKFTVIDVCDIGDVTAKILADHTKHLNKSYELTNHEKLTFAEMAQILSDELGTKIRFESPNLLHFYFEKRRQKLPAMLILVMIMLHYLPRFQEEPTNSDCVKLISGHEPTTFLQFVKNNKGKLVQN